MVRFEVNMAKNQDVGSRRAIVQLPSSPLWGYALVAVMAVLVLSGVYLIFCEIPSFEGIGNGCVGVIEIDGEILAQSQAAGLFDAGTLGSEDIAELVNEANERSDVKSILVIINSPGGSVVGSREIYAALKEAGKPKVAYFREMAASGGYYAALGTDYIVSEPDALTGSIGARMTLSDMSGLFEKIGYNETTIKTGEYKDIGSYSREMTDEEKEILQSIVDEAYSEFESVVLSERKGRLDEKKFSLMAADARIMTGRQAQKIGLVDEVGSKKDAILIASQRAGAQEALPLCQIKAKGASGIFGSMLSGILNPTSFKVEDGKITLAYR